MHITSRFNHFLLWSTFLRFSIIVYFTVYCLKKENIPETCNGRKAVLTLSHLLYMNIGNGFNFIFHLFSMRLLSKNFNLSI